MPFKIEKSGTGSKPWQVINETDGHVMGSFRTKGDAREQQKALYANIPEARPKPRKTT